MSKDNGGPAFARPFSKNGEYSDSQQNRSQEGMSLRDYFAAKAMHMFHGTDITCERDIRRRFDFTDAASLAYQYADAMLKERAK